MTSSHKNEIQLDPRAEAETETKALEGRQEDTSGRKKLAVPFGEEDADKSSPQNEGKNNIVSLLKIEDGSEVDPLAEETKGGMSESSHNKSEGSLKTSEPTSGEEHEKTNVDTAKLEEERANDCIDDSANTTDAATATLEDHQSAFRDAVGGVEASEELRFEHGNASNNSISTHGPSKESLRRLLEDMADQNRRDQEERDRQIEEMARQNRREKEERDRQIEEMARQNRQQVEEQGRRLRSLLQIIGSGPSLKHQILLAFVAGFFGYSPPLWFATAIVLEWLACCGCRCKRLQGGQSSSGAAPVPPQSKCQQIRASIRLVTFFLIFVVDFADAVVDFWTPIRDLLGYSTEENEDVPPLRGWATWYLLSALFGRTLGGVFAVLYPYIDESDRDLTYLIVELTILFVEDIAAIFFLVVKENYGYELTTLDQVNLVLSFACFVIFLVPTLCRWRSITQGLPRVVSYVGFLFFAFLCLLCLGAVIGIVTRINLMGWWANLFTNKDGTANENAIRIGYIVLVLPFLFMLYHWGRHLEQKMIQRQQQVLADGNPDPNPSMIEIDVGSPE